MHMKFNKKMIVASLSTVMGLSIVGAISGTVAWYQYSTRATTSFVGTSVAQSGLLQIKTASGSWMRDLPSSATGSTNNNKLAPVTFGALNNDGTLKDTAYTVPEYGKGDYADWLVAVQGKQYLQYDVYLRAIDTDDLDSSNNPKLLAKPVYLSDITIEDATANNEIAKALRVHISVDGGKKILLANDTVTNLPLYGNLDLDGDGAADIVGGYNFNAGRTDLVMYGVENEVQNADAPSVWKATRGSDGDFPSSESEKILCTTSTDANNLTKLTITVWLEGWAQLAPQADPSTVKAMWDVAKNASATVNVGLTFDVGRNAFIN